MAFEVTMENIDDVDEGDRITVRYTKPFHLADGSPEPGQVKKGTVDDVEAAEHGYIGFECTDGEYWWYHIESQNDPSLKSRSLNKDPSRRGNDATATISKQ